MLSVVVPLRDEAESLDTLADELARAVDANRLGPAEFLFVDDGSTDGSWAVIEEIARREPRARGLRLRRNFGKAAALSAGFASARGEVIFTLDGDLQDDPAEIPRFLAALGGGLDLVSGWKKRRHDPWHKVGPSRVFNAVVSRLTGCRLHDHNCGFKAYRREVLTEVDIYGELHRFIPPLAHARGFRVGELVVNHRSRRFGRSKYGVARFLKGLLDLLTVVFLTRFGRRPLHALGGLGATMSATGAVLALAAAANSRPYLFGAAVGLLSAGLPTIALGLVAELVQARTPRVDTSYSIASTTGHPATEPLDG